MLKDEISLGLDCGFRWICRGLQRGRSAGLSRRSVSFGLALLASLNFATFGVAQVEQDNEYWLKAGFIRNFIKLSDFPTTRDAHLLCILGSEEVLFPFRSLEGTTAKGKPIQVEFSPADLKSCEAIFVSRSFRGDVAKLFLTIELEPVLLIGELENFADKGGAIEFFRQGAHLRFRVNLAEVKRRKIQLGAKILQAATAF